MNARSSIVSLVLQASPIVQALMLLLLGLSCWSWASLMERWVYFRQAKIDLGNFEQSFWSGWDLSKLAQDLQAKLNHNQIERFFLGSHAAYLNLTQHALPVKALLEALETAIQLQLLDLNQSFNQRLSQFASLASISPYIGLFGTVWGVMNSFRGLMGQDQANLALVAPGIAEALIATSLGLVVAIPALLAFNYFTMQSQKLSAGYLSLGEELIASIRLKLYSANTANRTVISEQHD